MKDLIAAAKRVLELRGDNGHSLRDEDEAYQELHAQVALAEKPAKKTSAKPAAKKKTASAKKTSAAKKR